MIEYKKLRNYVQEVVKKSVEKACEINVNKMYIIYKHKTAQKVPQ